ncbi:hypothetical protein [Pedobacter sandarakinus]|uniref:hypothetical protein n=1 Tax=Pedobacter sandarakinus TaxID=353156 RepID=UPI0022486563|nr:hypothetical protein [Pedobacter sandarakinus]MCX2574464.1 hypothetical protein [Pedobacter sandarakinus]
MNQIAEENCSYCNITCSTNDFVCKHCGYPIHGTEKEQKTFIVQKRNLELDIEDNERSVNFVTNLFLITAGGWLVITLFYFFSNRHPDEAYQILFKGALRLEIYFSLALWSKYHPLPSFIVGLLVYFIFPMSGTIFELILVIYYIAKGISASLKIIKLKAALYYRNSYLV